MFLKNGLRLAGITLIVVSMSACSTVNKLTNRDKQPNVDNAEAVVDITRPPVTIKNSQSSSEESNPDETISYEKWKQEKAEDK